MKENEINEKEKFKFARSKLIILFFILVLLIVGATFALLDVSITNGNYNYQTTCFDVTYSSGEDILGTLIPSSNPIGGLSGSVTIGIDQSCDVSANGNLYLNMSSSGTGSSKFVEVIDAHCENSKTLTTLPGYSESTCTADTNNVWVTNGTALKYAVYLSSDMTNPLSVGYVNQIGQLINIYENFVMNESSQYMIYIWLDGELVNNSYANLSFSGVISADVVQNNG